MAELVVRICVPLIDVTTMGGKPEYKTADPRVSIDAPLDLALTERARWLLIGDALEYTLKHEQKRNTELSALLRKTADLVDENSGHGQGAAAVALAWLQERIAAEPEEA